MAEISLSGPPGYKYSGQPIDESIFAAPHTSERIGRITDILTGSVYEPS
jgi:hypothetical protein